MKTGQKLAAFAAAVVVLAGVAYAVGSAVGPLDDAPAHVGEHGEHTAHGHAGVAEPVGLTAASGGYTFVPTSTTLAAGAATPFSFTITAPDGKPVTAFDVAHEKKLHLIAVRRDTTEYQHVHPELAADGTWSVPLAIPRTGIYRVFADFVPTSGKPLTLGVDVTVPGDATPVPQRETWAAKVDGYDVRLDGDVVAGEASKLTAVISKDGKPVTDLQPYLGASAHVVALRMGDLAYLHVHADEAGNVGPNVAFVAEVPTDGTYRMFLDFKHADVVRTAEFTLTTVAKHGADGHTHE